jgi:cell shape-determining protein MreC
MFPLAVVVTFALALEPGGGFGLTKVFSEVFRIALTPFAEGGNWMARMLRPAPASPGIDFDGESAQYVKFLESQMLENERLYRAEKEKTESLQKSLDQLQGISTDLMKTNVKPLLARVGMRSAIEPLGAVALNRGTRHGVTVGTVAVYDAVHLIGQVVEVSNFQCTLLPLANKQSPLIDVKVYPRDRQRGTSEGVALQLQASGDGTFIAQVERLKVINPGDEAVLMSSAWPGSAQAMHVGVVESVKPDDMQPLRNIVVVRPAFQISQVAEVVLKLESDATEQTVIADGSASSAKAGGASP